MSNPLITKNKTVLSFSLLFFTVVSVSAPIKCWTNKDGIRECGDKIPPEYSQGASVKISKSGIIIAEDQAAKSLETIKKERKAVTLAEEAKKADQALLNTFSSVDDLILARDNKTDQINKEIILLESRIKKLSENLDKVKNRINAENSAVSNKGELEDNAERILSQIKESQEFIATKQNEKNNISNQFENDILRFQELITKDGP